MCETNKFSKRKKKSIIYIAGELVLFKFLFLGGGRRGRREIKDSVPERGKGEIWEGAETGKEKVVPS